MLTAPPAKVMRSRAGLGQRADRQTSRSMSSRVADDPAMDDDALFTAHQAMIAQANLRNGLRHMLRRETEEAARATGAALVKAQKYPKLARVLHSMALLDNDEQFGLGVAADLLELDPPDPFAAAFYADIAEDDEGREGAREAARNWFEIAALAGNAEAQWRLGLRLLEEGNLIEAEIFFSLARLGQWHEASISLAEVAQHNGDLDLALLWFEDAECAGNPFGSWFGGELLLRRGDIRGARQVYERAVTWGATPHRDGAEVAKLARDRLAELASDES